jgi:hypothetical protein
MLLQLAIGVIVAHGGIVGVMYLAHRSLMYMTDIARADAAPPFGSLCSAPAEWVRPSYVRPFLMGIPHVIGTMGWR